MLPEFDRKNLSVLGQGVWGTVLDMGDGTVLKLTKRKGGIGDGVEKAKRELSVLQALEQRKSYFKTLCFPKVLHHGEIDADDDLIKEGFSYWTRMSRMKANFMSDERFNTMTEEQKMHFARSLAEAIAEFHQVFDQYPVEPPSVPSHKEAGLYELKNYSPNTRDHNIADLLAEKFRQAFVKTNPVFGHGDLNFGNIAVYEDGTVEGFIDFAESFQTLPEDEMSHFQYEQDFAGQVAAHYETVSGRRLNPEALVLCAANKVLFGAVICEFCINEPEEAKDCRRQLLKHMAKLQP